MFKRIVFVFLFFFFCLSSFSQPIFRDSSTIFLLKDSASNAEANYDSSQLIHNYHNSFFYQNIRQYENLGAVNKTHSLRNDFFNSGCDLYEDFNLKFGEFSSRLKSTYFSKLKYLTGTRKEQIIFVEHQQRFLKVLKAGILFRGVVSPGFYKKHFNKGNSFSAYLNFNSRNKKYDVMISYLSNKIIAEESGGIKSDSLLKIYKGQETSIPVNLNGAEHHVRNKGYLLHQYFNFKKPLNDSSRNDLIAQPFVGLEHSSELSKQSFVYIDAVGDSGFYLNEYLSSTGTFDSLSFKKFSNELNFTVYNEPVFKNNPNIKFDLKAGVELSSYQAHQAFLDSSFQNNSAHVLFGLSNGFRWKLATAFKKSLNDGSGKNSYLSETKVYYGANNFISRIGGYYRNQIIPPDYVSEVYYSNHFIWRNEFENRQESVYKLFAGLFRNQVMLSVARYSVKGLVFYDEEFKLPYQNNNEVIIDKGEVNINYRLGHWHLLSENIFNFSSTAAIIRYPKFDFSNSIYYQNYFFKKALLGSIGAHCHYQSAYYADGLNPATGQFYLQHSVKVGDYPYVDVFLDMTIKTAQLFFLVEHVNAGIGERNYFYMPHYPTPARTLKFGLIWNFKN